MTSLTPTASFIDAAFYHENARGRCVSGAGIVLLPAPGPGMFVIAVGLALLAQESLSVAKLCDRAELFVRSLAARRRRRGA